MLRLEKVSGRVWLGSENMTDFDGRLRTINKILTVRFENTMYGFNPGCSGWVSLGFEKLTGFVNRLSTKIEI